MIYLISILIIILIISIIAWIITHLKYKDLSLVHTLALKEIVRIQEEPKIIWRVSSMTKEDEITLAKNTEYIELTMKYLGYQIAINTDRIRNTSDESPTLEKIWYVNALHSTYNFFHKINNSKNPKDEKYSWQELV